MYNPKITALYLAAILLLAFALRIAGIEKESLWFDETCSVSFSNNGVAEVRSDSAQDVHPPLYYLGLFFWLKVFPASPGFIRGFSLFSSMVCLSAIFVFAFQIAGRNAALLAAFFAAIHPYDIYFAQEARGYSQVAMLGVTSSLCLFNWLRCTVKNASFKSQLVFAGLYALLAFCALFTHYLAVLLLISQGVFACVCFIQKRKWGGLFGFIFCAVAITCAFLPWIFYVLNFRASLFLKQNVGWMTTPGWFEFFQFLGREIYVSRTGAAAGWFVNWLWIIPAVLFVAGFRFVIKNDHAGDENHSSMGMYLLLTMLFLPVFLAIGISHVYHPIFSSSRFSMFVLPYFVMLMAIGCARISKIWIRRIILIMLSSLWLFLTDWQYQKIEKENWKKLVAQWPQTAWPTHIVLFPETYKIPFDYYFADRFKPSSRGTIEKVLPFMNGAEVWVVSLQTYGFNAWSGQKEYYQWLQKLGEVENRDLPCKLKLERVKIKNKNADFYPIDISGKFRGFENPKFFHSAEIAGDTLARWSKSSAQFLVADCNEEQSVILNVSMPPPLNEYQPALKVFSARDNSDLQKAKPVVEILNYKAGKFSLAIPAPPGSGNFYIGWSINTVNLAEHGVSADARNLGLRIHTIEIK